MTYTVVERELVDVELRRWADTPDVQCLRELFRIWPFGPRSIVDRTGAMRLPLALETMPGCELPPLSPRPLPFRECMLNRASEILAFARSKGVPVAMMWSGGIDSTGALAALIRAGARRSEMMVLLGEDSIRAHHLFFERQIRDHFDYYSSAQWYTLLTGQLVFVTGEPADQLMGTVMLWRGHEGLLNVFYRQAMPEAFTGLGMSRPSLDRWMAAFEESLRRAPCQISSFADATWWMTFTLFWQECVLRPYLKFANREQASALREFHRPFYDSPDFQRWAIARIEPKVEHSVTSFKRVIKDFTYELDRDIEARNRMIKWPSPLPTHSVALALDRDFTFHDEIAPGSLYRPDNSFR